MTPAGRWDVQAIAAWVARSGSGPRRAGLSKAVAMPEDAASSQHHGLPLSAQPHESDRATHRAVTAILITALMLISPAAARSPATEPDDLTQRLIAGTLRPPSTAPASQPASAPEIDELTKRLIKGQSAVDLPGRIRQGMASAAERLRASDAGGRTQAAQRQAIADLDALIKEAEQKKQQQKSQSTSASGSKGENGSDAQQAGSTGGASGSRSGAQPAATDSDPGGTPRATRMNDARRELARAWGNLPQREREELMQGYHEQSLPKYREWIDRYYRTLADTARGATATQPEGAGP